MTRAQKLMKENPLSIKLDREKFDGKPMDDYIIEFKPGLSNPLQIVEMIRNDEPKGNAIYITYDSAVKLAKFLKELFLDEI
jgi:hypothetical protein